MNSNAERNKQTFKNIDEEDFISSLSDDILSHILNFLPTKDAVRTSILAMSWRNKWRLITSIDLHDFLTELDREETEIERAHSFIVSVNKVLKHMSNSTICKFGLHLQERTYDPRDLVVLFYDVLKREVQELEIDYQNDIPAFPTSVFNCTSLKKLVLDMDYCTMRVQSSIFLPNLQALSFGGIQLLVEDDLFPHSMELVLSFPMLKTFEAYRCDWSNVKDMSINAPMLETFTMDHSCFKFEHLDDEVEFFAIKINAPHLRVFSYHFISDEDIIFSNGSSIQKAHIGLSLMCELEELFDELSIKTGQLLEAVKSVEFLELGFDQFQVMTGSDLMDSVDDNLNNLPIFERLLRLKLELPRCLASQNILLNLIQRSPILQTLFINFSMTEFDDDLSFVEEVPHCFLNTLEEVVITVPEVDAIIITLAKYVLQHSRVLKIMTISLQEPNMIDFVNQMLLSSPKASNCVTIRVI
ncbi:hypothetical protein L6164_005475 [Bauhinia variegata]|uniref:Uncharacterized protein n=1 Tax=Bauhinia variegata TaxID=167791 RepID=A0ACB9PQF8_BAUVA|nr:hypothetical protein L6164_005475 [Bauhinia variegata]